jgi:hypothetical protein
LTTGWIKGGLDFEFLRELEFYLIHVVRTGSVVQPTSYQMETVDSFFGGKEVRA